MKSTRALLVLLGFLGGEDPSPSGPRLTPAPEIYTHQVALRMVRASRSHLAPVYAPLAEDLVSRYQLEEKEGIGIDLGGGPGTLIVELCKRTRRIYWTNADINPHFFPIFFAAAESAGVGDRVGAIFADARALPFRDDYADIVVSRGSFHFWKDLHAAFREIHRVLKPGGVAWIGRGFPENLPVPVARNVRTGPGKGAPSYDVEETRAELEGIMKSLGMATYRIHTPRPPGSEGINYGIWLEFRK